MTINELNNVILKWEKTLLSVYGYSIHTKKAYLSDLNNLVKFIASYHNKQSNLNDILNADIALFRSWLAHRKIANKLPTSSARAIASIKNFYSFLAKSGFKSNNAIAQITRPKIPNRNPKSLDISEVIKCINLIDSVNTKKQDDWTNKRDKALIILLYSTGIRIGEALSLKKTDIQTNKIKILGKGNKERLVPILEITKQYIQNYIKSLPIKMKLTEFIFLGKRGKKLDPSVFARKLYEIKKIIGLPNQISPHKFRHSFASHLLHNGTDLKHIQELLGHKNLSSTQIYTKIDLEHLKSAHKCHPLQKVLNSNLTPNKKN